ncbi:MAG: hypothetical protein R3E86_21960 [Pseudomonadales bacterium]
MHPGRLTAVVLSLALATTSADAVADTDPATGLVIAPGWELVRANCGACHSYRLVTAQRGDADFWLSTIRWMQRTQNLWPLAPQQEQSIIDYLSANYAETDWGRRPPLSPLLMPPEPGTQAAAAIGAGTGAGTDAGTDAG